MKQYPDLSYLLLSLLNHTCLDQLIEDLPNFPVLFHHSENMNHTFVIVDGNVKVFNLTFKDLSKTKNNGYVNLKFSDISELADQDRWLGEYQLEKNSIIWKINVEEKQSEIKIIRDEIKNLVNDFDESIKQIKDLASNASNPNLKKNYDLPVIVDLIK